MKQEEIKYKLGMEAAMAVSEGMLVGLGSGSTSTYFIKGLIERIKNEKLKIEVVASSVASLALAQKGGLVTKDINAITSIDLTVDGADEVDPQRRLIKGGGGAHVREKILASCSLQYFIIADESKVVSQLGTKSPLPVEIFPFGYMATINKLTKMGYVGKLRSTPSGEIFMTDNGNYLFDIAGPFVTPEKTHVELINIVGVIDTGFFFNLAEEVWIGYANGNIEKWTKNSSPPDLKR